MRVISWTGLQSSIPRVSILEDMGSVAAAFVAAHCRSSLGEGDQGTCTATAFTPLLSLHRECFQRQYSALCIFAFGGFHTPPGGVSCRHCMLSGCRSSCHPLTATGVELRLDQRQCGLPIQTQWWRAGGGGLQGTRYCCSLNIHSIWNSEHRPLLEPAVLVLNQHVRPYGSLFANGLCCTGVQFVFTLVGGHISPILAESERRNIRVIDCRHEVTAVFAADAVARLTGVPGVAAVTAGPGLTNTVTAYVCSRALKFITGHHRASALCWCVALLTGVVMSCIVCAGVSCATQRQECADG